MNRYGTEVNQDKGLKTKKLSLQGKKVVLIGASGGLGSAVARVFAREGADLILAGRNRDKLRKLGEELGNVHAVQTIDIEDLESIRQLKDYAKTSVGAVDILVNASGMDVRKPFDHHGNEEIRRTLDINLRGAIFLTQEFLPSLTSEGTIVHIGGFGDGRLAFPYHAVDVASRAGLFSFIEAVNRELVLEGNRMRVAYFSPSPADTDAERPYHPIWQRAGMAIVSPENVAQELLKAIHQKRSVYIMGGWVTKFFVKLNAVAPRVADGIYMRGFGEKLRVLGSETAWAPQNKALFLREIAFGLVIISFVLYGGLFLVPFLKLDLKAKAFVSTLLIASGEATFWIGGIILGKEIIGKIRTALNPCSWARCLRREEAK